MVEEHLLWCHECLDRAEENLQSIRENGREHLGHIATDSLENYLIGRIEAAQAFQISMHLLECTECTDRLMAVERFITILRSGVIRGAYGFNFDRSEDEPEISQMLGARPHSRFRPPAIDA